MSFIKKIMIAVSMFALLVNISRSSAYFPNESDETITVTLHADISVHEEFYNEFGELTGTNDYSLSWDGDAQVPPGGASWEDSTDGSSGAMYDEYGNITGYFSNSWTITYS